MVVLCPLQLTVPKNVKANDNNQTGESGWSCNTNSKCRIQDEKKKKLEFIFSNWVKIFWKQ